VSGELRWPQVIGELVGAPLDGEVGGDVAKVAVGGNVEAIVWPWFGGDERGVDFVGVDVTTRAGVRATGAGIGAAGAEAGVILSKRLLLS
jgi:hypothetical protein